MKDYYEARAEEYDNWWLGRGLFADRERPGWDDELGELCALLASLPAARTLDVACGTGFITQHLPGEVTGLDQSASMIGCARKQATRATFVVGDALALPFPDGAFDRVFTSYFYCHLEDTDRWTFLAEARRVAPELVVLASRPGGPDEARERWEERRLEDGSSWQVFKRVFEPEALATELGGEVLHAGRWFVAVRAM